VYLVYPSVFIFSHSDSFLVFPRAKIYVTVTIEISVEFKSYERKYLLSFTFIWNILYFVTKNAFYGLYKSLRKEKYFRLLYKCKQKLCSKIMRQIIYTLTPLSHGLLNNENSEYLIWLWFVMEATHKKSVKNHRGWYMVKGL